MDTDNHKPAPRSAKREDRPKSSPKEDLDYRISGLEKAKLESGMTSADIGALNRAIAKLYEKKAEKAVKPATQEEEQI
jgi:hypothetical protein